MPLRSIDTQGDSTLKTSIRKSSAYHADFERHLIDHGIHTHHSTQKPHNWDEIRQTIAQPRQSLSPLEFSDGAFEAFRLANQGALTEAMVMRKPFPLILGNADIFSAEELPFGNLEPLTDGTLVDAKPGFYDGARPTQINRQIRTELGSYITPSTQDQAPALPNFFLEAKGPDRSAAVAKRQACYDGALGARGIHELRSFRAETFEAYDRNAYTITSTYYDGLLRMYTIHPEPSADPENPTEYYMTPLKSFVLTDDP
ncbi:MAG: hypothetical protein Q9182_006947 [Xanthomendoza sp. 2 TL-2023]